MAADEFVAELSRLRFSDCFNPYADVCQTYDRPDAVEIRKRNLERVLDAALDGGVDAMWVGRDLGHRGGRRTGLALTDDNTIEMQAKLWGVSGLARATRGDAISEATAQVVGAALNSVNARIFLWNVFPLHPHGSADSFSNRKHSPQERSVGMRFVAWLVERLSPTQLIAVGGDAAEALGKFGYVHQTVRHPSYGGKYLFLKGISKIYGT